MKVILQLQRMIVILCAFYTRFTLGFIPKILSENCNIPLCFCLACNCDYGLSSAAKTFIAKGTREKFLIHMEAYETSCIKLDV